MSGYTITKNKKTDINQILLSIAFVLILSAIFVPLFFLIPIQGILFMPKGYWVFEPSLSAYITFISGILAISVLLIIKVWLAYRGDNGKKSRILITTGIVVALVFILLSFNRYHYIDKNGIHINPLLSVQEIHYSWDDVEAVTQTVKVSGGVMRHDKLIFTFENGDEYAMLLNENARRGLSAMLFELRKRGIEMDRPQ